MPRDELHDARNRRNGNNTEEAVSLLSDSLPGDNDPVPRTIPSRIAPPNRRQSSFSKPPSNGQPRTPRTPNRVRFNIQEQEDSDEAPNEHLESNPREIAQWVEGEEEDHHLSSQPPGAGRSSMGQRAPLLTDIEAPSVTVANADLSFDVEDLLESSRPKSGMRSAFMNMANSIM